MNDFFLYILHNSTELSIATAIAAILSSILIWICDGKSMNIKAEERIPQDEGNGRKQLEENTIAGRTAPATISIIVSCHNQANELKAMLERIFKQDFARYEIVVVNMASTDNTADVLRS